MNKYDYLLKRPAIVFVVMKEIRNIIRKCLTEVLDINPKMKEPFIRQTGFKSPIGMKRSFRIGENVINMTVTVDQYDHSVAIAFAEEGHSFGGLTGSHMVGRTIYNVFIHSIEMLDELSRDIKSGQIFIDKIIIHPEKMGGEEKINALDTKRGRLYKVFIDKYIKAFNVKSDSKSVTIELKWPLKLGKGESINRKMLLKSTV